ncbi:MAG: OmpA family protein [Pseudomonadota bacterium]
MKLDDGLLDQKLSLDLTPLIDVVFLLVLFFALSTSFISAKDLSALKDSLVSLVVDKRELTDQVAGQTEEIVRLGSSLETLESDYEAMVKQKAAELVSMAAEVAKEQGEKAKLQWMIDALEKEKDDISKTLSESTRERADLAAQLEQAYKDYNRLDIEVKSFREAADAHDETEALLIAMLKDRAAEKAALNAQLATTKQNLATAQADATEANEGHARLLALIAERSKEATALATEVGEREQAIRDTRAELDAAVESQALLLSMLRERAIEKSALNRELSESRDALSRARDETSALSAAQLEEVNKRALLQALIAEKASENEALAARLESLSEDDAKAAAEIELLRNRVQQLRNELARFEARQNAQDAQVDQAASAQRTLQSALATYLSENKLDIKQDRQKLTLQLSDRILFDSGSATIKREGIEVLRRVGAVLRERLGELEVQVGGHTDNVPVRTLSGFLGSNWGLSAARAVTVVRFFEREIGIEPTLLSAVGYSEFRPRANNDTSLGRSRNRRIEIVLLPRQ